MTRLRKWLRQRRAALLFWALAMALLLAVRLVLQPIMVGSLGAMMATLEQLQRMQDAPPAAAADSLVEDKLRTLEQLARWRDAMPKGIGSATVVDSLLATAKEAGVKVQDVSLLTSIAGKDWVEYPIQLKINASMNNFHRWLYRLENGALVTRVRSFQARPGGNSVEASVSLSVFVMPKESRYE